MNERNALSRRISSFLNRVTRPVGLQVEPTIHIDGEGASAIRVEFQGADAGLLLANNAELLDALEHVTGEMLRFSAARRETLSFDAAGFRKARTRRLSCEAMIAVNLVTSSGRVHIFAPMNCRDRGILVRALANSGLRVTSSGVGLRRHVELSPRYPHHDCHEMYAEGSREYADCSPESLTATCS